MRLLNLRSLNEKSSIMLWRTVASTASKTKLCLGLVYFSFFRWFFTTKIFHPIRRNFANFQTNGVTLLNFLFMPKIVWPTQNIEDIFNKPAFKSKFIRSSVKGFSDSRIGEESFRPKEKWTKNTPPR